MRSTYGMELNEYDLMLEAQAGVCAICGGEEVKRHRDGTLWALSVDHDHKTGRVRGLLCSACNVGLSNFRESTEALTAAIQYLQFHAVEQFADEESRS